MKITKYRTELDENKHSILVKESSDDYAIDRFNDANMISKMLNEVFRLGYQTEEHVYLICFTAENEITGVFDVSCGTATQSMFNPREILIKAFLCNAVSIIVAHNHPGGDTKPSQKDIESTVKLKEACKLIGIHILDHIIVGSTESTSLKGKGII